MKTRTKATTAPAKVTETVTPRELPVQDTNPRKAFILPEGISSDAKIVTLAHPATLKPTRFFHCSQTGFYEIKQINSGGVRRSLLLTSDASKSNTSTGTETANNSSAATEGYVMKQAAFFAVTPIDPAFLLIPALSPVPKDGKEYKPMFLTLDDHLDSAEEISKHLRHVCRDPNTLKLIERRIVSVCDKVSAGDESMFRLNQEKLLAYLIAKAERMVSAGLPASMEAQFVKKALEVPMAQLLHEESQRISIPPPSQDAQDTDSASAANSQLTAGSSTPRTIDSFANSTESQSTTLTVPSPPASQESRSTYAATPTLIHLQRLRTALTFLFTSYLPTHLTISLEKALLSPSSPLDLSRLNTHLASLATLRSQISASARDLIAGTSRKRTIEDEEAGLEREEKKRRKDEEERKRKAGESRGVRDLKKVNVSGMKKMSAFFGRKT